MLYTCKVPSTQQNSYKSFISSLSFPSKMRLSVKIPNSHTPVMAAEVEEGEPLSPWAMFYRQPQFNCNIIFILGFGKILTIEEIKLADNSWRQKLRWVPTKVNLDEHVFLADPGPEAAAAAGDPTVGDLYVENYITSLSSSPLDFSRPLWDLHLLAIRTSEAACVAVFRLSHSIGDGISHMSLLHACTHRTSDPESLPSLPKTRRRPAFVAASFGRLIFLRWIWTFLIYAWNTIVEVILLISTAIYLKDTKTLIMAKEGVEYRPKRIVHCTLCLDDIIAIKNTIGCTINDVLVGVTSAALSRYLSRSYGGFLPKDLRIRTSLIVNIRQISGINDLADMMKEGSEAKWGNRIGAFLLRLPVIKCEDPLDYVRNGAAITDKKKKSLAAIFTYKSFLLISKCLGTKVATAFFYRIASNTTLTFSNIVGPIEEVSFCGSPLVYIAPSVYGHPQALMVHVQSYMNKIKVVIAVDELAIPDPHRLLADITDSLQIMKDAATSAT
ncbi:hypothetical protein M5K25_013530 [Dendrobium thyrsiflorum]|uniref:Diacylglycerol O-acyltransferase n=1 Tax=Dendrobium thyrsiflorum TaxID=117978 RepID=A0ABD0V155_DENTH